MIKGRDTSFELRKFEVVSETGERREQLGLAGVQVGEVVTIISDKDDSVGISWIIEELPVADEKGVLGAVARAV